MTGTGERIWREAREMDKEIGRETRMDELTV